MALVTPRRRPPDSTRGRIRLLPTGNLGNQMLQVLLLDGLRRQHPCIEVGGIQLSMWGIEHLPEMPLAAPVFRVGGQFVDIEWLTQLFSWGVLSEIEFGALGFDLARYPDPNECRALFDRRVQAPFVGAAHQLVINVRGAETLDAVHPDYAPLPLGYYRTLIAACGLEPVFMGQLSNDPYSNALRASFPKALFLPSFGPMPDFEVLRSSCHVAASVSTFSWLACWVSDARTVHLPVSGIFDPRQRADISLLPTHDPRYVFYDIPPFQNMTAADWERHVASTGPFRRLGSDDIKDRISANAVAVAALRTRHRLRMSLAALDNRLLRRPREVVAGPLRPPSPSATLSHASKPRGQSGTVQGKGEQP